MILQAIRNWYFQLQSRERSLVTLGGVSLIAVLIYLTFDGALLMQQELTQRLTQRKRTLSDLTLIGARYVTLTERLEAIQSRYSESVVSTEDATRHVARMVKQAVGSDNYEWTPNRTPEPLAFDFEKREAVLRVRSISLEQVLKLLYEFEQGKAPLFLGEVDVTRAGKENAFTVTLDVFSIRKK